MPNVDRLRQVFIVVEDMQAATAFYQDTLGLALQFRDGDRWVQFQAGPISLALASEEEGLGARPGVAVPVFEVADLDTVRGEVASRGFEVSVVREMGPRGRAALARDPSGVGIVFFQKSS